MEDEVHGLEHHCTFNHLQRGTRPWSSNCETDSSELEEATPLGEDSGAPYMVEGLGWNATSPGVVEGPDIGQKSSLEWE